MHRRESHGMTPQLVIGLIIIVVGLLFMLDHLGFLEAGAYLRYWPVLLMIYGLSRMSGGPNRSRGMVTGGLFAVVGLLLLLRNLDVITFSIWHFWPLILVFIGVMLVWRAFGKRVRPVGNGGDRADGDSQIHVFAMLGGVERRNSSQDFKGGEITAILGGCELDLRGASIRDGEAVIDVFTFWGGIDIRVPADWAVSVESMPLMGGCEDKTGGERSGQTKHLIIRGYVVMGGLEIGT